MVYGTAFFDGKSPKATNIFVTYTSFVITQLVRFYINPYITTPVFFPYYYAIRPVFRDARRHFGPRLFLWLNKGHPRLSWTIYCSFAYWGLFDTTLTAFEADYAQAWRENLQAEGGALDLQIFVGRDALSVPILFNKEVNGNVTAGNDRQTLEQLSMWYNWMQYKRGFGERILPRRLIRINKVGV
jgi:hypothetical protein